MIMIMKPNLCDNLDDYDYDNDYDDDPYDVDNVAGGHRRSR